MAGTILPKLTVISLCDALTGWTAVGGTNTLNDPTIFDQRQGTYCIQNYGAALADRGSDYALAAATDFSNTVIYCWFAFSKVPHATNPMKIRVTDGAGNWREWNIFTKAILPHLSWIPWVVHTQVAYDAQSAVAPVMTAITKVGWRMAAVIAKVYIYFDAWRYGTGLQIYGGTSASGDEAVLEKLYTEDSASANAYGVIDKLSGVYYVQGQIEIGSTTEAVNTYFKDKSQVVVFKNVKVPADFYNIIFQGKSGQTTEIYFGDPSTKVSGLFIKSEDVAKYKLTATDTNITKFGLYGCSFVNAGAITLPPYNINKEVVTSNFESCAEVIADTCIITKSNFISSPVRAIRISSTSHNVTECNFINCQTAVRHDVGGPITAPAHYDYNKLMFTGGTYHIENSAVTPNFYIDIDRLNGSNPDQAKINNSGGGTTTILAISVVLTLTGLIAGSDVRVMNAGTTTVLASTDNSGTTFNFSYDYVAGTYVDIVVHSINYEYYRINSYLLSATNSSIPISQRWDRNYLNP